MKKPIQSPRSLLAQSQKIIAQKPRGKPQAVLQEIVQLLHSGRRYAGVAIYVVNDGEAVREASVGTGLGRARFMAVEGQTSEFAVEVPVKIASRCLALLTVKHSKALGYQERVLLKQVAQALRKFMVSSNGRLLQRKLRSAQRLAQEPPAEARLAPAPDHTSAREAAKVATVS